MILLIFQQPHPNMYNRIGFLIYDVCMPPGEIKIVSTCDGTDMLFLRFHLFSMVIFTMVFIHVFGSDQFDSKRFALPPPWSKLIFGQKLA